MKDKKNIILLMLACFLIPLTVSAQQMVYNFSNAKANWPQWEIKLDYASKKNVVQRLFQDPAAKEIKDIWDKTLRGRHRSESELLSYFHVLDIDRDGLTDVLYNGFFLSEDDVIYIYRNTGNGFEKTLETYGKIINVSGMKDQVPFSFTSHLVPCCGIYVSYIETYVPVLKAGRVQYQLSRKVAYIDNKYGTDFPQQLFDPVPFKVIGTSVKLRVKSEFDNQNEYIYGKDVKIGNDVADYPRNSIGYALLEQKDQQGNIWWFVVMSNNITPKNNFIYDTTVNKEPFYSVGWMDAYDLQIIE